MAHQQLQQYESNERTTPKSTNTLDRQRLHSYLRSSGHQTEALKIQDLVTNCSQDHLVGNVSANVTTSDIRQIKLNYLQHNKRTNVDSEDNQAQAS